VLHQREIGCCQKLININATIVRINAGQQCLLTVKIMANSDGRSKELHRDEIIRNHHLWGWCQHQKTVSSQN
jgi:hypothetical protein